MIVNDIGSYSSELHVVEVSQLQLFTDVLTPSGVEGYQIGEEMGAHGALDHVGIVEHLLVVVAFHPAAGSFNIFAVILQNLVNFFVLV